MRLLREYAHAVTPRQPSASYKRKTSEHYLTSTVLYIDDTYIKKTPTVAEESTININNIANQRSPFNGQLPSTSTSNFDGGSIRDVGNQYHLNQVLSFSKFNIIYIIKIKEIVAPFSI